jgi:hypothetical protein
MALAVCWMISMRSNLIALLPNARRLQLGQIAQRGAGSNSGKTGVRMSLKIVFIRRSKVGYADDRVVPDHCREGLDMNRVVRGERSTCRQIAGLGHTGEPVGFRTGIYTDDDSLAPCFGILSSQLSKKKKVDGRFGGDSLFDHGMLVEVNSAIFTN